MAVQNMRVAACAAVFALSAAGFADEVDQANPDTKALLEYVKKLESRVNQLEQEKEWPLSQVRGQSETALEAAVKSINLSGFMEFQYAFNLRHGGTHLGPGPMRGDTLSYSPLRGSASDDNGFSFQTVQLLADKPLAAMGSTGFRVRAEFGQVSKFDNRDGSFTDPAHAFDVREAFMAYRMETKWGLTSHVDFALGKMDTPLGMETPDANDPANFGLVTRNPIHTLFTPQTHTGLRATLPWSDCNKTSIYVVNGWDNVRDSGDGKTLIVSHEAGRFDWLNSTITINGSYGHEGGLGQGLTPPPGSIPGFATFISPDGNKTKLLEVIWKGEIDEKTKLALDGLWERMDKGVVDSFGRPETGDVHAVSAYVRHDLNKDIWISGRLGYFSAEGPGDNLRVADASVALGWNVAKDMTMAVEYRHDKALSDNKPFFTASGSGARNQDTLTASFVLRF